MNTNDYKKNIVNNKTNDRLTSRSTYLMRIYSLVIVLIVITNLSIFGFISKKTLTEQYNVIKNAYTLFNYSPQLVCSLVSCKVVVSENKIHVYDSISTPGSSILVSENDINTTQNNGIYRIYKNIYLKTGDYSGIFYKFIGDENPDDDFYIDVQTSDLLETFLFVFFIITILTIILVYITVSYILEKERNQFHFYLTKNTSKVQNDIFYYLTLNIHHEMNTPLFVMKNNTEKILKDNLCPKARDLLQTNLSYLEQLFSIINNMKEFKRVKHSNGDKTIHSLCQVAINLINEIKTEKFDSVFIDERLKRYGIDHNSGLENGDLVNNVINHIKNSLNANACHFFIQLDETFIKPGFIKILLIDSGNGIKPSIIKKLYSPNIIGNTTVRGEGMGLYLNNLILSKVGGEDKFESTQENKGTVFSITIPVTIMEDQL